MLNEFGTGISKDKMCKASLHGLNSLCKASEELDIKVTFFVTDMVGMFSREVGLLAKAGHEIALHSVVEERKKEADILEYNLIQRYS